MGNETNAFVALFANVGNRDVFRNGEPVREPRSAGENLLKELSTVQDQLTLPLLGPALRYLLRVEHRIDRVVLFATDQPATTDERHRATDTLHFAEIAQRLIEGPGWSSGDPRATPFRGLVTIRLLQNVNPALYDEAYDFYCQSLPHRKIGGSVSHAYVLASGGTPAMNLGLLVAAVERFPQCDPLYLREGARQPQPLNLGEQLRQGTLRRVALSHLRRYQFAAAGDVIAELKDRPFEKALAAYAAARLNFDWRNAWRTANDTLAAPAPADRRLLERLREEAAALEDQSDPGLFLGERYHRARVAFETGAYSEFLVWAFALQEAALHDLVANHLGIDYTLDSDDARDRRRRQVSENPGLRSYLDAQRIGKDRDPLDWSRATVPAMLACLRYLVDGPPTIRDAVAGPSGRSELEDAQAILLRIDRQLSASRNRSVHGAGGASRQLIDDAYNPPGSDRRDLLADLAILARLAGGKIDDWAVERARVELIRRLEE
jgi:hypothetical protein